MVTCQLSFISFKVGLLHQANSILKFSSIRFVAFYGERLSSLRITRVDLGEHADRKGPYDSGLLLWHPR